MWPAQRLVRQTSSLGAKPSSERLDAQVGDWVAHASRVLVGKPGRCFASVAAASRRNELSLRMSLASRHARSRKVRDREDALASTRDVCATQGVRSVAVSKIRHFLFSGAWCLGFGALAFPLWLTLKSKQLRTVLTS